ncbi:DUF4179 domain-containing protein [Clostridium sp. 'White wine YQ']|uniref:DUF4179 domain-containing protein n=1 Tax=Clostridium sp. 'White wine YQ' TaxID=3027474 RepID=UPI00236516B7|nr:DUF4179 domain-containing protein [Clostridium sp. 'White wine YQ']MDD7795622.1 DUF4179 domain-containing protein [Clostridium sp. 'White wine YQ']
MKEDYIDNIIKRKINEANIKTPDNIKNKIDLTLMDLPEKRRKSKRIYKVAAGVILSVGVLTAFGFAMPTYAQNIPIIGSIFKLLDRGQYTNYDKYASDINITKEDNGVSITITSIVYDGLDLNIAYKVDSEKPMQDEPHLLDKDLAIDGKITTFGSGGGGQFSEDKKSYVGVETLHVSKNEVPKEVQDKMFLGGYVEVPDKFTLTLNIKELLGDIKGKWSFNFQVTNEKVNGKVKEFALNKDLSNLGKGTKLTNVTLTPINTEIQLTSKEDIVTPIIKEGDNPEYGNGVKFLLVDNNGRQLADKSGSGAGNDGVYYYSFKYRETYENTKSVTIIPYIKEMDRKRIKRIQSPLNLNGETKVSLGKFGDLIIDKIEIVDNKTKVHYRFKYGALATLNTIRDKDTGKEYSGYAGDSSEGDNVMIFDEVLPQDKNYIIECDDLESSVKLYDEIKLDI